MLPFAIFEGCHFKVKQKLVLVVEETPRHVVTMPIKTDEYDPDSDKPSGLSVLLKISHTPKYPEEIPLLDIEESDNMSDEDLDEFKAYLATVVSRFFNV